MKLNDIYWLYAIECVPTGKVYIGKTGKPNPCWRWADHFVDLRNGISQSPLLQQAWDEYPEFTHWRFSTLDKVEGKRQASEQEAKLILETPESLRLNTSKTSMLSLERRQTVERLLSEGRRYIDIRDEVGISLGMISKIKKTMSRSA